MTEICCECHSTIQPDYRGACPTCLRREIKRLRAERPTCEWTRDGEVYETACGDCFELTDGDALADQPAIQWCPFCGGRIFEAAEAAGGDDG